MCSKFLCPLPGEKLMSNLEFERRSDTDLCKVNIEKMLILLHLKYIQLCIPSFKHCPKVFLQSLFEKKKPKKPHSGTYQLSTIHNHIDIEILNMYGKIPNIFSVFFLLICHCFYFKKMISKDEFLTGNETMIFLIQSEHFSTIF